MSRFISAFAPSIEAMLAYREALGFSRRPYEYSLMDVDRFCAVNYPHSESLTQEMVFKWIEGHAAKQAPNMREKATAIRLLGKYLAAIGKPAYLLPKKYVSNSEKYPSAPYIFTDAELAALFRAADMLEAELPARETAPVLFRLIYTCGLRPNEGRGLKRDNINFSTGEILITKTKRKKERIVVMSGGMLELCKAFDVRRAVFSKDSEYFFPAQNGEAYGTGRTTLSHFFIKTNIFTNLLGFFANCVDGAEVY